MTKIEIFTIVAASASALLGVVAMIKLFFF